MMSFKVAEILSLLAVLAFVVLRLLWGPGKSEIKAVEEEASQAMRDFISLNDALFDERRELLIENAHLQDENARLRHQIETMMADDSVQGQDEPNPEPVDAQTRNALEILGLEPVRLYDKVTIRAAYIRSVRKHHPDQGGTDEGLRNVLQAYNFLAHA